MKKWRQKAIVQKAISYLPFPHRLNFLFQKYVTRGVDLSDEYFTDRLGHASAHIAAFDRHARGRAIGTALELGTGWYPVVPIALFLRGARSLHTVDIHAHCSRGNILAALRMFRVYQDTGRLRRFVDVRAERWTELCRLVAEMEALTKAQLLERLGIRAWIADARRLPLDTGSVDLITSNNTFEHIDPPVLRAILAEFGRIAAKGAVMSHFIDMSDHFAHFDRSITVYNYLQYSRRQWARIDNRIQPQNRLRITDYRALYAEAGIALTEEIRREGRLEELATLKVHPEFAAIPASDLAVSHCLVVSRMG